jgi:hypothetical protein
LQGPPSNIAMHQTRHRNVVIVTLDYLRAGDGKRWDDLRSGPSGTELARPHHLWYSRLVGRLAAWELTLSFELSFSVLKEGGSQ